MSIEETIVLGQIPGTDYQPEHTFWFSLASCLFLLWVMYELYVRVHASAGRATAVISNTSPKKHLSSIAYSTLSLHTPTISSDYALPVAHRSHLLAWKNTFGVQLQLFKQKVFTFGRFLGRQFSQAVHKLTQSALFATIKQRMVSVRLPSRTLLVTQATRVVTRLEQWEQVSEAFIVKTSRQLWRQLRRLRSAHDTE